MRSVTYTHLALIFGNLLGYGYGIYLPWDWNLVLGTTQSELQNKYL
jgi:hypothetical protein